MTLDIATGITISLTGWSGDITNINFSGMTREPLDTSHQGTTNAKTFTPADLYDGGEFTFDAHFDAATGVMIDNTFGAVTVTFPAGAYTFDGFVTTDTIAADLNEIMLRTVTVKISGEIT